MSAKLSKIIIMLTVEEIRKSAKGTIVQDGPSRAVNGISIDSRTIKKGNAFIAIEGPRFNGHKFVSGAVRKGAGVVVVSRRVPCDHKVTIIRVKDTTKALGHIAAYYRKKFLIPVIAVTGSTGKTTTKEMIAAVLETRYKVLKNVKTENNQFGIPLTLFKLNASHKMAVLELGTNRPGDIRWLTQITQPTTAVWTNIGESHLERLKSCRGVFLEKSQLLKYMKPKGAIIFNIDDRYLKNLSRGNSRRPKITFACSQRAKYRARQIAVKNNRRLDFTVSKHKFIIRSPVTHNVYNALAAIACGRQHRISYPNIQHALSRFKFDRARQEIVKIGRYWLIDDTYNANPLSLASAIGTLNALDVKGKRIAVCGDMLELGGRSKQLHRMSGKMIARSATDVLLTTGTMARYMSQGLNGMNKPMKAVHCKNHDDVHRWLKKTCSPGDAVLVKGSRGMRMEQTVLYLKRLLQK